MGSMAVATAAVEVYRKSELFDDEGDVPIKSKRYVLWLGRIKKQFTL